MSRRATLMAGAGVAAGMTLATGASAPPLSRHRFTPLIGATIGLHRIDGDEPGGRHTAVLDALPGTDTAFTMRFAAATALPEGIYRLDHRDLAPVDLFIAPTGPTGRHLEAVVNLDTA